MPRPSRTASIATHFRCNQNCTYCISRSPVDRPSFIARPAVEARIEAALSTGASEIVLTGGEPTMRVDLPELVAHARKVGAERVVVETNATLLDPERARALRAAGLDLARVNVVGLAAEVVDRVTRDPGGFDRTMAGLDALVEAGVAIEILMVAVRSTLAGLAELPGRLAERLGGALRAIQVGVPVRAPEAGELVPYEAALPALLLLERRARAAGVPLRMDPGASVPPCVFPPASQARVAHMYSLTPGTPKLPGHTQLAACASCILSDRCSGLSDDYLARFAPPPMHPVTEDRMRRRLSLIASVPDQIAAELVSRSMFADEAGRPAFERIVRINFHCNQACSFCFVSTHLPSARDEAIEEAIRAAGRAGDRIVISGGEPTLNPRVVDYVRLAKSVGRYVSLQTNAVLLDDAALVEALAATGLDEAFVSLHGSTAGISDGITEAPGTFVRTLAGIDNLSRARLRLVLNFVICDANRRDLVPFVRMVAERWPRARVNVSFVAPSTDLVPHDRRLVPRYSDVLPSLAEAIAEAKRLRVQLCGFESMCGIPLCLIPPALGGLALAEIPPDFDRGEFLKTEQCAGCARESTCYGLRRGYAELYGADELRRVTAA